MAASPTNPLQIIDTKKKANKVESDDEELIIELKNLVDIILSGDSPRLAQALKTLRNLLRNATASMTSVPKPLKYLGPHYEALKTAHDTITDAALKQQFADILSVLSLTATPEDVTKSSLECLKYCMMGSMLNVGEWGHEYLRQLEADIIEQLIRCPRTEAKIESLLKDIVAYNCQHHAEIQACDLCMEIDRLDLLSQYIDSTTFERVCLYLLASARFVEEIEIAKVIKFVGDLYMKFGEYSKAFIVGIQRNDKAMVNEIFHTVTDPLLTKQLAFIAARQLFPIELREDIPERDDIISILNNSMLSTHYLYFARELDIMEPKIPEDVYKTWLEPSNTHRLSVLVADTQLDSARQNLASSIVNGFVNAGFGADKLLAGEAGNRWIYRNRDHGMLCATAALGLIHLWDVDGGLTPIDKYLYSKEDMIKGGALLALGLVNCRVRNECDPALALLADFVTEQNQTLRDSALFGLGLAYIATNRSDVMDLLQPAIETATNAEGFAMAALSCGLVGLGSCSGDIATAIVSKLVDWKDNPELFNSPHMLLALLGLGLLFTGHREAVETPMEAVDVLEEPLNSVAKSLLQMCGYAGTGDVCIIHEFLRNSGTKVELDPKKNESGSETKGAKKKLFTWEAALAQSIAVIGLGLVSMGEEIGCEMSQRLLGSIGSYADPVVRRSVPLVVALTSVSKPHLPLVDLLIKYAHDNDDKVSVNAIFALGIVGAGTNNARLAASLRQLAVFHSRNSSELFMIRLAQGLVHLGKGTMTLSPLHTDRQLVDHCAIAGLLIPIIALLEPSSLILASHTHLLYGLVAAMQPGILLTLNESLEPVPVLVRVGQTVDIVGKAGTPRSIAGIHTHTTPVLLATGERAELATQAFSVVGPALCGVCIVKKEENMEQQEDAA